MSFDMPNKQEPLLEESPGSERCACVGSVLRFLQSPALPKLAVAILLITTMLLSMEAANTVFTNNTVRILVGIHSNMLKLCLTLLYHFANSNP